LDNEHKKGPHAHCEIRQGSSITLPQEIWDSLQLKRGELFEVTKDNGHIPPPPRHDVDDDEWMRLSEECRKSIQEGLKDIEEGRYKDYDTLEDALRDLNS